MQAKGEVEIGQLVERAVAGDAMALEKLLLRFHDPLLAEIRRLLGNGAGAVGAEDMLQEVMVEAFRRVKGLEARGEQAFWGWLKAVARTRVINRRKGERALKRGGGQVRDVAESVWERIAGMGETPSLIVRKREAVDVIAGALRQLEPERQEVIRMRYGEGMKPGEIAKKLGKSEGAVKMLISRTVDELRAAVTGKLGETFTGA